MADTAALYKALRNADKAGDVEGAKRLAKMIRDAEAQPASATAPADDGVTPVPVDDSWFPAGEKFPGYTAGHEFFTGVAKGVGNLPNLPSNIANAVQRIANMHLGSGESEEFYKVPQVMGDGALIPDLYDKSIEEMNPQTPGWEGTRRSGEISGSAAPVGLGAMLAAPLLTPVAETAGEFADTVIDPNDQRKWEQTLPLALPFATRYGGAPLVRALPGATKSGGAVGLFTGSPTLGLITATAKKAADLGVKGLEQLSLSQLFSTAVIPPAVDDSRKRGAR